MNNTTYKARIIPPLQYRDNAPSVSNREHLVLEEVKKSCGTYNLTAEFVEDKQTLDSFAHVPGLIAFVCSLRRGTELLGVGRGSATISRINKYLERTVRSAYNASLIDAVVRSTKTLDVLYLNANQQNSADVEPATDRQKKYLLELMQSSGASRDELNQINTLTKEEASEKINILVTLR